MKSMPSLLQGGLVSFEVHFVQPSSLNDRIFFASLDPLGLWWKFLINAN
jgi:hypothetical protein